MKMFILNKDNNSINKKNKNKKFNGLLGIIEILIIKYLRGERLKKIFQSIRNIICQLLFSRMRVNQINHSLIKIINISNLINKNL